MAYYRNGGGGGNNYVQAKMLLNTHRSSLPSLHAGSEDGQRRHTIAVQKTDDVHGGDYQTPTSPHIAVGDAGMLHALTSTQSVSTQECE